MSDPAIYNRAVAPHSPPQQQNQFSALRDYVYRLVHIVNRHNRELIYVIEQREDIVLQLAALKGQVTALRAMVQGVCARPHPGDEGAS